MATAARSLEGRLPPMTRRARTFFGCLTCRKRKVKCDAQQPLSHSPCKNCSRLDISCIPSFHSNFKNSSLDPAIIHSHHVASPRSNASRGHANSNARFVVSGQIVQGGDQRRRGQGSSSLSTGALLSRSEGRYSIEPTDPAGKDLEKSRRHTF